jgi:outer membrane protein
MKRFIICLAAVFALTIGTAAAAPAPNGLIGVIDVNKIMAESPQVQAYQDKLTQKGQELTTQLNAEKPNLSEQEYKQKQDAAYKVFLQLKKDLEGQIDSSITTAIEQVAKEKGLSTVVYKNSVAFGGMDITKDVMNKMK